MGGEKSVASCTSFQLMGSPPRGRGKVYPVMDNCNMDRITPAHAGKRWAVSTSDRNRRDHPRVGGEKAVAII